MKKTISLDLDGTWSGQCVTLTQGDSGWLTIEAEVTNDGKKPDLDGYDCYLVARLPNGSGYQRKKAAYSGGVASVTLLEEDFAAIAGFTDEAAFQFVKGSVKATTGFFALDIRRDPAAGGLSEGYDSLVDEAVAGAQRAASDADAAADAANAAAGKAGKSASSADDAASAANKAAGNANSAAAAALGSVGKDPTLYLAYDTAGGTDYLTLVDTEEG